MSNRERVLVLAFNDLSDDSRVRRQVEFLASRYDVIVAAPACPSDLPVAEFAELEAGQQGTIRHAVESFLRAALRQAGLYQRAYWLDTRMLRWRQRLRRLPAVQAVVVNDLAGLPLAFAATGGAPVVFDAHEHWTSESASWTRRQRLSMRRAHEWVVDHFVPRTAAMMTVSAGIARDFSRRCGVSPALVTNAPFFQPLSPSEVGEPIRLLHFGVADPRRRLEDTVAAVRSLDGAFTLDLALARDNPYRRRLERLVAEDDRVRLLPAVPSGDLLRFANAYDVGVFLLPATFPNQVHVLPNKLFDYIQARLAVAIGPSPEMAGVVRGWECGVVSSSFSPESFAESLSRLTIQEVERMKRNADKAARVLNADANRETVISLVRKAVGSGKAS